ncbi:putative cytochrome P450 [Rhizodiscina lignyota]|uniref:Cytochrome P450 n=1 Tax=Rhizodiscina lignyota TaxID=1504668 RepID=A0A9P4IM79_9PEZI|nr:putative cytochrome P450 [Rhizodiscina lignyota]
MTVVESLLHVLPLPFISIPLVLYIIYFAATVIYRIYFSPLSKFPGPKFAAATYLVEIYYDAIKGGQYVNILKQWHKQYAGPIIRITPDDLHVSDPSFYSILYSPTAPSDLSPTESKRALRRHKSLYFCRQFGTGQQAFQATCDHDLHRYRRAAVERFFSPANIKKLQGLVRGKAEKLCSRLLEAGKTHEAQSEGVRIKFALSCFATDVITNYALGSKESTLDRADFFPEWSDTLAQLGRIGHVMKVLWFLLPIVEFIPVDFAAKLDPGLGMMLRVRSFAVQQITKLKAKSRAELLEEAEKDSQVTVYHDVLTGSLPEKEKSVNRLKYDSETLVGAGTETTGASLAVMLVYILSSSSITAKLQSEIDTCLASGPLELSRIEKLPYLTAVLKEGLRLSYGICGRLPRIAEVPLMVQPADDYKAWVIPPGTPVSMDSYFMHTDASVWGEDVMEFKPERWLDKDEAKRLERYLVPFTKGGRMCVGINLAYAELYLCLAALVHRFDMELVDTTIDHVQFEADWFVPKFKRDLKDIRVIIKERRPN